MPPAIDLSVKPKKIIFDDDGEVLSEVKIKNKNRKKKLSTSEENPEADDNDDDVASENGQAIKDEEDEEDFFAKEEKLKKKYKSDSNNESQKKWFQVYPQYPSTEEILDIKEKEQTELFNICKAAYETELPRFVKKNPNDSKWLLTAIHKGTAKDRANAGALLVTSNPMGNMQALETLIGYTKMSNKSCTEVISILTDLIIEVLLPAHRKLLSIPMRAADWKALKKDESLTKEQQRKIFAYWYFENELKDQYFEFLKNLQQNLQTGQENNKTSSIVAATRLLSFSPEKEQMLLTMLINKLGDPIPKVASKALHHLSEVAYKHPNMCGVITAEAEKLLFRNNISERAQHFALCFLAQIAPSGRPEVCTKLVNICFALFKVLVKKGAINNRTMQAILRCLQKAIVEAQPAPGSTEIMTKEMQDTIYRLVHLADIRISIQTLSLLLQLVTVKTEKSDRFYNALYRKMLDMELTTIGNKTAAQFLHIVHRAIHIDSHVSRAQAFIKRLLQMSLYFPAAVAAGCLIVIHKLLRSRLDLKQDEEEENTPKNVVLPDDAELAKFDSDGEEKYEDVPIDGDNEDEAASEKAVDEAVDEDGEKEKTTKGSSWHHAKLPKDEKPEAASTISATKYDPYHRVPAFAGAEYALQAELLMLMEHFHPTVQVFAESILNKKRIDYYGDPLRDFSLPHFLERFAFKNPKKLDKDAAELPTIHSKRYVSYGARGKPVKSLTKSNCTEDEMFIFNYLEKKRETAVVAKKKGEDEDENEVGDVDDDEFEEYLDGFFGKKKKKGADEEDEDEELDFLKELGGELKDDDDKKKKKKKKTVEEDDDEDMDDDEWDDDMDMDDIPEEDHSDDEAGSIGGDDDDEGSISLDEGGSDVEFSVSGSENDDNDDEDDDDELKPPKSKKSKKSEKPLNFSKALKGSGDMSSLFAAADDFAELLEETGKTKGQGTSSAVYNKDKSSDKQMKWEENRRSNSKNYMGKGKKFGGSGGAKKFSKKRKS
ncbi:CCAAT/enhancer-binding protein zeta [Eupeodes corollae]|uniref:CCAAT/enhancer-binding protein zeta n=1 Tax=Eupeodes corollae TaxID=290404 RepID=UPI0024924CBA|nr:CCAAT/enhancer-binding protein zeta [Eupeodes corollae]